jgi:MraZ protein
MAAMPPNIFTGEHRHTLDDKNRLIVPFSLRPKGARELIVVRHPNGYLAVFTKELFNSLYQSLIEKNKEPKERRSFIFMMNHLARTVAVDAQGRMGLAQAEVDHVRPGNEVIFTRGSDLSLFEIWNASRHDAATLNDGPRLRVTLESVGV